VEERDRAFERYDDALAAGHGGYLLDEERPNIFTLSVGNLAPGAQAVIEVEYVTLLEVEGARTRFSLPTTISPRYVPNDIKEDDGIPLDEKLHPAYAEEVPYGLSLSLRIHGGKGLRSVESPSHPISIGNMGGDPVSVTFSTETVRMDRDFVLYVEQDEASGGRAYLFQDEREAFFQLDLNLASDEKGEASPQPAGEGREIIFVVDCSGSMMGDSILQAKKAIEVSVRALEPGTFFDIYRFGSNFESLFGKPKPYDERSASRALTYIEGMDADLGGTEILAPLREVLSRGRGQDGRPKDMILLTDGEVGNEEEIFRLVRESRGAWRIFPVGIGAGCNEHFIKGLARAGQGASEFIYPGERIEPKVLRIFAKTGGATVSDLVLDWGSKDVDQAPLLPAVFLNSPLTLFARCGKVSAPSRRISVTGLVAGKKRRWEFSPERIRQGNSAASRLWARERIRDLEEDGETLLDRGSRQRARKEDRVIEAVIELSRTYGILSHFTSFVGVEEREEKDRITGELVLRKVPALVTVGWHGLGRIAQAAAPSITRLRVGPARVVYPEMEVHEEPEPMVFSCVDRSADLTMIQRDLDLVLSILAHQKPRGGIEMDEKVAKALRFDMASLRSAAEKIEIGKSKVDRFLLLSTAVLLQVLEVRFRDTKELWADMIVKSVKWLERIAKTSSPTIHGRPLTDWARDFVKGKGAK
jgi:Ca-activated chloride channel family protein